MKKKLVIDTKIILGIITVVDIIWGSGGGMALVLWIFYGLYKSME